MTFKEYLKEKWLKSKMAVSMLPELGEVPLEIFKNPTEREVRDIIKSAKLRTINGLVHGARLASLEDGTILVWRFDVSHDSVSKFIKSDFVYMGQYDHETKSISSDSPYDGVKRVLDKETKSKLKKQLKKLFNTSKIRIKWIGG